MARRIAIYAALIAGGFFTLFPFLWSLFSSFKPPNEILTVTPSLLPSSPTLANYIEVLGTGLFGRWYLNSLLIAAIVTLSVCVTSTLGGYSLAKFKYRGRQIVFLAILSTMMIPLEMLVISWFAMASSVGLVDTYLGLMFPGLMSAFGVFLMRQFMSGVPDALLESARIDGASEWKIFHRIVLPQVRPAVAALAIFTFIGNWDALLWPLIVTSRREIFTLPVGLQSFAGAHGVEYHLIIAASNLVVIPVLLLFLIMQRRIIKGITLTGLKG